MINFIEKIFLPITAPIRFVQRNFKSVLFFTILLYIVLNIDKETLSTASANLAQVEIVGPIILSDNIIKQLDKIKNDENIKGVLIKINSPGGAVDASVEIAYAIKELNELKPVVSYASGVIASGSYYASLYSSKIIANPGSIVGSIGVIISGINTEKLMEKIGIETQTIKAGKYKSVGTSARAWDDIEKQELSKVINDTYDMFVDDVLKARKLQIDKNMFADGHIFTARQAKDIGLIDEVATISKAKEFLIKKAKVDKPVWQEEDRFEKFVKQVNTSLIKSIQLYTSSLKAY
ncbi:MAG: signal peptide peptidase SppA [Epsilonproteobacteria bacterium]|nr:MAG: signal peptide peptidase SppA [Campylobacterota bacterium]